ncbi:LysR family transcriptional regulator [Shewanella woodyi]|uniref:LysR family transcriptional regulator n=1 Tax=Shewanella woodyi TaxID=60961 RepID=UPI0007F8C838|nr:LysR family transcriptional regulator [Shewanella woodyi]
MHRLLSRLDYFTLKVFIGLVEYNNGSVVAQKLNTTQPKVSRALSCVREVFCDELFVRRQYGVKPNAIAENLYPFAKAIVSAYDEMAELTMALPLRTHLIIAAQEHLSAFLVESIMELCKQLGSEISVTIQPWSDNVQELLAQGKIDFAIAVNSESFENVESVKVGEAHYHFVAAKKGHPLFSEQLNLANLFKNKLVLINYSQVGLTKHWCEDYADERGLELKVSFKTSSLAMALAHVAKSNDVCWTASVFACLYFKSRNDIDYIDVTDFYENELFPEGKFKRYDYYLQYHKSLNNDFSKQLSDLLSRKMQLALDAYAKDGGRS